MTSEAGSLERIARFVGEALSPLKEQLDPENLDDTLERLGLVPPADLMAASGVSNAVSGAAVAAQQVADTLPALVAAIDGASSDDPVSLATLVNAGVETLAKIRAAINAIEAIATAVRTAASAQPPDLQAALTSFARDFRDRLIDRLLVDRALKLPELPIADPRLAALLKQMQRRALAVLAIAGLADDALDPGDPQDLLRVPYRVRRFRFDEATKLAHDPKVFFGDLYGWGRPDFDGAELFKRLANNLAIDTRHVTLRTPPAKPAWLEFPNARVTVAVDPDDAGAPGGVAVTLLRPAVQDWADTFPLGGPWSLFVDTKLRFEGGLEVGVFPNGRVSIAPPLGEAHANLALGLRAKRGDGKPITIISLTGATRLEMQSFEARAGAKIAAVASPGRASAEPTFEVKTEGLNAVLDVGAGDGFLKSISGGGRGKSDITVGASWSPARGLRFTGSAALEIAIPAHARLGPATIETIYLIVAPKDGEIPIEISAALRGELGPFKAVVDRVGATLTASFPNEGGNLGPMQLDVGFKPPSGVGLSIDGGGFSGGGFLRRDPASGEYAGALELTFQDTVQVKAFGVLNTRTPEGAQAYSLVVVISAEFTPIQLSFGFTLLGVGGLLGVNRTALYDQLRSGVRDGSLASILFPKDLVANAPRIIADLKRMFPPRNGRYLIGPMAKLGWGTPTLISLELGVILEIPRPAFALIGVLRLAAPADDVAILDLKVSFLGVVDFDKKELSFDASLFDSRLLSFTLTGDMAVRLYWGDNANFLLTAGGFHPDYTPPPLALPPLRRLAISMWAGNPRLSAEAYFAVTSNTVQFGAKVELYYGVKIFNVYGFISLDALIQFDPFHFIAKIAGQVAVRSGGSTLFSIRLELTLEGPTPWHARGRGSFEIGFIVTVTITASFEVTFGEERNTTLAPIAARSMIEDALSAEGAWRALAPQRPHVSLRELGPRAGVVIPPTGALVVSQKVAPLNLPLARIGARRVEGPNRFSIVDVSMGPNTPATHPVQELFAPAQFLDLSDAQKLSRGSFEPFDAGVEITASAEPRADYQTKVDVVYEVLYVRKPRRERRWFHLLDTILDVLVAGSAAARSPLSAEKRKPSGLGTPKVTLAQERFVVAGVDDLRPHAPDLVFASQSAAVIALDEAVRKNRRLAGKLQVVSSFEAAA